MRIKGRNDVTAQKWKISGLLGLQSISLNDYEYTLNAMFYVTDGGSILYSSKSVLCFSSSSAAVLSLT
jgi:hypothetical protein